MHRVLRKDFKFAGAVDGRRRIGTTSNQHTAVAA
jgi:hypothetical protein